MMTRNEFNRLSLNDRARKMVRESHFLTSIDYCNYQFDLYSLSDYFVEVKLTAILKEVESISIAKGQDLDKFINAIVLPAL